MNWPVCLTESETLDQMEQGISIARFGDGELACAQGRGNGTHKPNKKHAAELRKILTNPAPGCLPAIPTMLPAITNFANWERLKARFLPLFDISKVYGSAFVGRADVATWISTREYMDRFHQLWAGKKVAAVHPDGHGLPKLLVGDGATVDWIECPYLDAYSEIDEIEEQCLATAADVVVICAGPAATCLANRLAGRGMFAIDLGRGAGMLLRFKE